MYTIKQYVFPNTVEQAYETLLEKKSNTILGGCMWLKMGKKKIYTAVDLSKLHLSFIEESDQYIEIGSMTTLRELEKNSLIQTYADGILSEAVRHIVGVQFRNSATVGGSIFSLFGFSDVLTALMALNAQVELFHGGRMSLEEFSRKKREKDILMKIILPKKEVRGCYKSIRNAATDFPLIAVAVTKLSEVTPENGSQWNISVGARPGRAVVVHRKEDVDYLNFETDMRAEKEYRASVCHVLVRRAMEEIEET